jgi:hypothetical protein
LNVGDKVQIYYLESLGSKGEVGAGAFTGAVVNKYNSPLFQTIYKSLENNQINTLNTQQIAYVLVSNLQSSTTFGVEESVDEIRYNAPKAFRSSGRLVTLQDFETYVTTQFSYFLSDVKAINNWDYISSYLKYYYDLGITKTDNAVRPLYNQITFADACNFNNIYLVTVPKSQENQISYTTSGQKEYILNSIQDKKVATSEIVFIDPVYKAFAFGLPNKNNVSSINDLSFCKLVIVKDTTTSTQDAYVLRSVINTIGKFFSHTNNTLGQLVDLKKLLTDLSSIQGVKSFYTYRTDTGEKHDGLAFFAWNPAYPDLDIKPVYNSLLLQKFEYAFFYNFTTIADNIIIESNNLSYQVIEY